jgi:uncharacterized protein (DUF4415 family)
VSADLPFPRRRGKVEKARFNGIGGPYSTLVAAEIASLGCEAYSVGMTDQNTPLSPLPPHHERFVLECLEDGNATRAYLRAGIVAPKIANHSKPEQQVGLRLGKLAAGGLTPSPRLRGARENHSNPWTPAAPEEPRPSIVSHGLGPPDPPRPAPRRQVSGTIANHANRDPLDGFRPRELGYQTGGNAVLRSYFERRPHVK